MQKTFATTIRKRFATNPKHFLADFIAGLTLAIESIPDSMASALLAGISPLAGLYTMIVATPIGALFTSSEMMHVSTTSAISLAVGSTLIKLDSSDRMEAVVVLALLVGIIQIALGLGKMGFLIRFVPFSVMTGFINGVAVLIILGQFQDLTGYKSGYENKVFKALDTVLNLRDLFIPTLLIGLVTILLIIGFGKIKRISQYSLIMAMILSSVIAALPGFTDVKLVRDVSDVPNLLPGFTIPNLSMILNLIIPAIAIAIIGLVQGAGISQTYPNHDGRFPDPSGDFLGQGAANVATSFFQGMPAGGSLSGTALVVGAGAKTRWANVLVGIIIAFIILIFADLVKLIAMPALAGLLMVIGFQTIQLDNIQTVWNTGILPRVVMIITFTSTLIMPLQDAVFLGVGISIMLFVVRQANRIKLVEIVPVVGGFPVERPAPRQLASHKVTLLYAYGSLFYAAAKTLEEDLPSVEGVRNAAVIFLLRGHEDFGSTMIGVLERYHLALKNNQSKMFLSGLNQSSINQLENTGLLQKIGPENVFVAQAQWGFAASQAYQAAQNWLAGLDTLQGEHKS